MKDNSPDAGESDEQEPSQPVIPDGGYGWIVTFASFMCHFIADGIVFSFGIIYPELLNTFGASKSATSWIGSLFVGIPLISGPLAGLFVTKYGCRSATIIGGLITSLGMLVSSFSNSLEMLTFTYGVVAGFGLAFIYVPASVMPSFWFDKRRSLATGIAVSGSGLGTFALAPFLEYLLGEYGWRGTLLILSGLTLNFMVFGALFRDVPHNKSPAPGLDVKVKPLLRNTESLPSIASFQSLHSLHSDPNEGSLGSSVATIAPTPGSPGRKHHSTNTIYTGEEFEQLYVCDAECQARKQSKVLRQPTHHSSIAQLLHSNHNLLPVSRRDITSVMTLALRHRTVSSCPDISISAEDAREHSDDDDDSDNEGDGDDITHKASKKTSNHLLVKVRNTASEMCDIRLLAVPVYLLFFISNFILSYAYDLPYLYIPDYASTLRIDKPSFLIAIIGIVNTFGQVLFGYLGDRKCIDTLLLYGASILLCGVLVTVVPLMKTYASLAAFSVLFGLFISANFSLETVVLVKILSLEQLTRAYGLLMFGQGVASLIGPPIGGKSLYVGVNLCNTGKALIRLFLVYYFH